MLWIVGLLDGFNVIATEVQQALESAQHHTISDSCMIHSFLRNLSTYFHTRRLQLSGKKALYQPTMSVHSFVSHWLFFLSFSVCCVAWRWSWRGPNILGSIAIGYWNKPNLGTNRKVEGWPFRFFVIRMPASLLSLRLLLLHNFHGSNHDKASFDLVGTTRTTSGDKEYIQSCYDDSCSLCHLFHFLGVGIHAIWPRESPSATLGVEISWKHSIFCLHPF